MKKFYANPAATIIIILAVTLVGIVKFNSLPVALYPLTSKPSVWVSIFFNNTTSKDFLERYGDELERALKGAKDIDKLSARYSGSRAEFEVEFDWGIDNDEAVLRTRTAIDPITSQFPNDWGTPWIGPRGGNASRVMISASSTKYTADELTELLESTLMPRVESIEGMAGAFMTRFDEKYILITMHPDKLLRYKVSPDQVIGALEARGTNRSLGEISEMEIQAVIKPQNLRDIEKTIIVERDGYPVYLDAVATVNLKEVVPENFFKANGERALIIGGLPKPDANIKGVCDAFLAVVEQQVAQIDPDIKVDVLLNPSKFIRESINNVLTAVLIGMIIATLVVFFFLRSFRNTVVICISIPLSLIGGVILMDVFSIEINLISLGAMALAVGMVVDSSIVVLENVVRHLEEKKPHGYWQRLEVITEATKEVRGSVIAALLTTIIVFAPLPFTSPLTSAILGDLAIVMVCVLTISVFVTLLLIPPLILMLQRGKVDKPRNGGLYILPRSFSFFFDKLQILYLQILHRLLRKSSYQVAFIGTALAAFIGAGWLVATQVPREIMAIPDSDKVFLFINYQNEEFELEESEELIAKYEQEILDTYGQDLSHILTQVEKHGGWVLAFLKDESKVQDMKVGLEERFKNTPLMNFFVMPWNPTSLQIPDPPILKFYVSGKSEAERRALLEEISDVIRGNEMAGRTEFNPSPRQSDQLVVRVDQERLLRLKHLGQSTLSENEIYTLVQMALDERLIQEMEFMGDKTNVKAAFPEDYYATVTDVENLQIRVGDKIIPLKALANLDRTSKYTDFYSEDGKSVALVELWAKDTLKGDRDLVRAGFMKALQSSDKIDFSKLSFENADAEIDDNINSLVLALGFALLLIAILITLQFGGILQALIIMLAIPFGFIGVSTSLWLFGSTISVNSMLGFILLCGTAVNNSILLIDFYNQRRTRHHSDITTSVLDAANLRFRPILITTLTTVLGMMPIALAFGNGGKILQPLGIAICGGLGISTLLTLFLVPLAIQTAERLRAIAGLRQVAVSTVATLLVIAVTIAGGAHDVSAEPLKLDLRSCEALAVKNFAEVKVAELAVDRARYGARLPWSEVLPSFSFERTYAEQEGNPPGPRQSIVSKAGQTTYGVEQSITNPYVWYKNLQGSEVAHELSQVSLAAKTLEVASRARVQWVKAKTAERALFYAEEALTSTRDDYELNRRRFQRGFIGKADADRGQVLVLRAETSLTAARNNFRTQLEDLKFLIGAELETPLELSGEVPDAFAYFTLADEAIRGMVRKEQSLTLSAAKLRIDQAAHQHSSQQRLLFPNVSIGARYQEVDPAGGPNGRGPFVPHGPEYFASVDWKVHTGGQAYYNMKQTAVDLMSAKLSSDLEAQSFDKDLVQYSKRLKALQMNFQTQLTTVKLLKEIYDVSRSNFEKGLVSSKVVSDDYSAFLDAQDGYLQAVNDIVDLLSQLSVLAGDSELFYKLY